MPHPAAHPAWPRLRVASIRCAPVAVLPPVVDRAATAWAIASLEQPASGSAYRCSVVDLPAELPPLPAAPLPPLAVAPTLAAPAGPHATRSWESPYPVH